jgi:hypothetical protein
MQFGCGLASSAIGGNCSSAALGSDRMTWKRQAESNVNICVGDVDNDSQTHYCRTNNNQGAIHTDYRSILSQLE